MVDRTCERLMLLPEREYFAAWIISVLDPRRAESALHMLDRVANRFADNMVAERTERLTEALLDTAEKYHYQAEHHIGFEDCYHPVCKRGRSAALEPALPIQAESLSQQRRLRVQLGRDIPMREQEEGDE